MIKYMKRLWRNEDGTSSVEFALMFPILMFIFLMAGEMGVIQLRQAMLERSMDIAVREVCHAFFRHAVTTTQITAISY